MNWNMWIRQLHRWVSIAFTVAVIATFVALAQEKPVVWVSYLPLLPLALLLLTGLYLFVLPHAAKWRSGRRVGSALLMTLALTGTAALGQEKKAAPEPLKLKVGDPAPDFTLLSYNGQKLEPVSLHDYKGKKQVALAFFVFAFTGG